METLVSQIKLDLITNCASQRTVASTVLLFTVCVCISCSVVSDSLQPHRPQPTRPLCPWDSPGKNTGVGCISFSKRSYRKKEREVSQSCPTRCDPMDCSLPRQAPPSTEFSRQEYCSLLQMMAKRLLWVFLSQTFTCFENQFGFTQKGKKIQFSSSALRD